MDGQSLRLSGFIVNLKRLSIRVKCWTYSNEKLYCSTVNNHDHVVIDLNTSITTTPVTFEDNFYTQGLDYPKTIYQELLDYSDYESYNISLKDAENFNKMKRQIDYAEGKWRNFPEATTQQEQMLTLLVEGHADGDHVRKGYIALGGNLAVKFQQNYEGGYSVKGNDYTLDYILDSLERRSE